jgi:hypothetical protein
MVKRMRARDYRYVLRVSQILDTLLSHTRLTLSFIYLRSAADAYVGVAIGNAAWPIGVTMVGIHERRYGLARFPNPGAHCFTSNAGDCLPIHRDIHG